MSHAIARAHQPSSTPQRSGLQLQRKCACQDSGQSCARCSSVPDSVTRVLETDGSPLDASTRRFMEDRFQRNFSDVRIHTDTEAARSADAVGALAYTVGNRVVFSQGAYAPQTHSGRFLLAHELAHSAQQRAGVAGGEGIDADPRAEAEADAAASSVLLQGEAPPLRSTNASLSRFEKSERARIAKFEDVMATATAIANKSGDYATIDWGDFVRNAGGFSKTDALKRKKSKTAQTLPNRYLMTCRCGLIDMRHFYQLMYISRSFRSVPFMMGDQPANRQATFKGREHELTSEQTSRFAPEDTPSNAMGALLGSQLDSSMTPKEFLEALRAYLRPCLPIDFGALPAPEQDQVVNYYGERAASGAPQNSNETATPAALTLSACSGKSQAFPFELDPVDRENKTLARQKAPYTLTGDTAIRDWVRAADAKSIDDLPGWEKIRLIDRLLNGWVSDADVEAIERICRTTTSASEMTSIDATLRGRIKELRNARQRERVSDALGGRP